MSTKPVLRFYAAGGCGLKTAHNQIRIPNVKGYVKPVIAAFDSSKSDIDPSVDMANQQISHTFLNADGMGKNRKLAADIIRPEIKPFLEKNPPGDVNIVNFSLSGGTGSVAGLGMVKELITRGENVVAMVVGNATNQREATNTLSTLNDLRKLAVALNKPVPIMYYENATSGASHHVNAGTQSQVDNFLARDISSIACLCSGAHIGIDSKDVTNLFNYQNVTNIKPRLVELCATTDFEGLDDYEDSVISMLAITKSKDTVTPDLGQPYEVKGTWASDIIQEAGDGAVDDFLFLTTAAVVPRIFSEMKTTCAKYAESAKRVQEVGNVDEDDFDDLIEDVGI